MTSLPLAHVFMCFSMFVLFALTGGNLTDQRTGELEAEFKFHRRSCQLSFLVRSRHHSALESLLNSTPACKCYLAPR